MNQLRTKKMVQLAIDKENGTCKMVQLAIDKENGTCKMVQLAIDKENGTCKMVQLAIDKENDTCKRYLLLQGLYVPSVKTTIYVCNRFNTSFRTRDHKTHWTISCYTLLHQVTRDEGKNSLRKHFSLL